MSDIKDLSKLCLHTITTKPWTVEESAEHFARAGVRGMSVWREALEGRHVAKTGNRIRDHGLEVVSLVRGGFFASVSARQRQAAIEENERALDEAAALGAPLLVLVCGSDPAQSLGTSRDQIMNGISALLPRAEALGVKMAIEPLHPMYADTRSAVNTLRQANEMAEAIGSEYLGIAVDVYHLWWDPDLEKQIGRCGNSGNLFAFHICDWNSPTVDMLNDRGLMGEGCIPLKQIRTWVEKAGFKGFHEVEIFSHKFWGTDQHTFLQKIIQAYLNHS